MSPVYRDRHSDIITSYVNVDMFIFLTRHSDKADKSLYNIISWSGLLTMPRPEPARPYLVSVSFYNQLYGEENTWTRSPQHVGQIVSLKLKLNFSIINDCDEGGITQRPSN